MPLKFDEDVASQVCAAIQASVCEQRHFFDFLGLPRELRDHIYKDTLPEHLSHQDNSLEWDSPLGLLLANKQINKEYRELFFKQTPYLIKFRSCYKHSCSCIRSHWGFDPECFKDVLLPPNAADEIVVHCRHIVPALISPRHESAIRCFDHIKISFAVPASANHEGCESIPQIVESLASTIDRRLWQNYYKKPLALTVQWTYKTAGKMANKPDSVHSARIGLWIKALKKHNLVAKVIKDDLRRSGLECELVADLKVTKSS